MDCEQFDHGEIDGMTTFDVRITGLGIDSAQRRLGHSRSVTRLEGLSNDPDSEVIASVDAEDVVEVENTMVTLLPLYCSFSVGVPTV